jgi:ABC-2 type transport system ATP-binding protein
MILTQDSPVSHAAGDADSQVVFIRGLSHAYGERQALRAIDLDVRRGEIFGFLGPNGSGKTTLFRVLSTLIPPQHGQASVLGHDLATRAFELRRHIGVVFQYPSLDIQLSAEENLRHHGHLYGLRGAELKRRMDELLDRVGLSDRRHERVHRFSGGMRRRVELAKGLLNYPRVLLLDEPSTGIDPGARIDLWRYLRQIQRDGVTILLTTHLMEEADQCTRLAIMDGGRLVACDAPLVLKEQIGGDVITVTTARPQELQQALRELLEVEAEIMDQSLRIERRQGHQFVPQLIEAFPGMINSVSVGKPTLEDVFIHLTGHRLDRGEQ